MNRGTVLSFQDKKKPAELPVSESPRSLIYSVLPNREMLHCNSIGRNINNRPRKTARSTVDQMNVFIWKIGQLLLFNTLQFFILSNVLYTAVIYRLLTHVLPLDRFF